MNRLLFLFGLLFFVFAGGRAQSTESDSAYIRDHYTKKEVYITMRDGVRLFTSIYAPKDQTRSYPILLKRTPYTVAPYGEDQFVTSFQNMTLAREGYIWVFQDVRGRWMSEGEFEDIRPINTERKTPKDIDESTDTYDTADWLVRNVSNNNGRIGVYGISYPGFYATNALVEAHPAVKAVSPQAPVTDWFIGDDFHHNGAFLAMDAFSFYRNFGRPRPRPTTSQSSTPLNFPDNYQFYLDLGPLPNYKKAYMGDSIRFWNDLMAHPNLDAFWKARSIRPHLHDVSPAVMVVGGLFDAEDCFGAWRTYEAVQRQNPAGHSSRLVMGPWFHGGWARSGGDHLGNISFGQPTSEFYQKEIEARFFDYYLRDQGKMDLAEATIFETGSNLWTQYAEWPPKAAVREKIYLQPGGGLAFSAPAGASGYASWISDPAKPVPYTEDVHSGRTREYMDDDQRFAARRPDVLVFQTDVLDADLTVTGPIDANIYFSTSGTDADLVVKVIDVFPDDAPQWDGSAVPQGGYQMLVRGEVMRGRFRNSYEKPEPFKPGEPAQVRYQLPDIAHTFKKGHRLMVQIQSSWFPLVDRNPQTFVDIYHAVESDFQQAEHRVYFDRSRGSYLEIGVLKK